MDARHVVEGPGDVGLAYSLAGVGPRFLAALLDHLIVLIGIFLLAWVVGVTSFEGGVSISVLVSWALLFLAYFSIFEGRHGRTPGKAAMGLRVIDNRGDHASPRQALLRNLLRAVDTLPLGYFTGVLVMSLDANQRRFGDLVAGTVVVKEGRTIDPRQLQLRVPFRRKATLPPELLDGIRITPEEYQALRTFCFRTRTLPRPRREALAVRILTPLYARAGRRVPGVLYVEELLVDLMHHLNDTFGVRLHGEEGGKRGPQPRSAEAPPPSPPAGPTHSPTSTSAR